MKKFRQLLEGLPSKTVVFVFGRFNPPTIGHELLFKVVKKVAETNKADHVIYASKSQDKKKNPLSVDRKVHYLNLMFPQINFVAADAEIRTFIEAAKLLNKRYKNLIMIAGSDRVLEYTKLLNTYNGKEFKFNSIKVISAGERDPDSDAAAGMSASKMRAAAVKGDYSTFKGGLPSSIREIDSKLLMNEIRQGMGFDAIKEQINLVKDDLREQYFHGEIFNVGDIVESNEVQYEIVKRGSNHLLLKEQSGKLISKWIQDITATKGNKMNEDLTSKTIRPNDKLKVARIIASFLSVDNAEQLSNPEQIINLGLRKIKVKVLNKDSLVILHKMLNLADEVNIEYDIKLVPNKLKESIDSRVTVDKKSGYNAAKNVMRYTDFKKLLKINKNIVTDDDKDAADIYQDQTAAKISAGDNEVKRVLGHDDQHLRHRKIMYQREEVEIDEGFAPRIGISNFDRADKKGIECNPFRKEKTAKDIERINAAKKADEKHTGLYKKQTKSSRKNLVKSYMDMLKDMDEEVEIEEDVATAEYTIKNYVDPITGENKSRKIRPHRITFKASGAYGVPAQAKQVDEDVFSEEEDHDDIDEKELDKLADTVTDIEDVIDAYDDDELAIIDDDGEELEKTLKEENETLNEVLSRMERIRAKTRFARTSAKRKRAVKLALKRHSGIATINRRARKLAINILKQRLARKPLNKLSTGEKERIERTLQKRKALINRLTIKLIPKVRKIENNRLSHKNYTKSSKE